MKLFVQVLVLIVGWMLLMSLSFILPTLVFLILSPVYLLVCFVFGYSSDNIAEWILEKLHV